MPAKEPLQAKNAKQPTRKSAIGKTGTPELADDDLKAVSGGLSSTLGTTMTSDDTGGCISKF